MWLGSGSAVRTHTYPSFIPSCKIWILRSILWSVTVDGSASLQLVHLTISGIFGEGKSWSWPLSSASVARPKAGGRRQRWSLGYHICDTVMSWMNALGSGQLDHQLPHHCRIVVSETEMFLMEAELSLAAWWPWKLNGRVCIKHHFNV